MSGIPLESREWRGVFALTVSPRVQVTHSDPMMRSLLLAALLIAVAVTLATALVT
jgi:hypothetical protein